VCCNTKGIFCVRCLHIHFLRLRRERIVDAAAGVLWRMQYWVSPGAHCLCSSVLFLFNYAVCARGPGPRRRQWQYIICAPACTRCRVKLIFACTYIHTCSVGRSQMAQIKNPINLHRVRRISHFWRSPDKRNQFDVAFGLGWLVAFCCCVGVGCACFCLCSAYCCVQISPDAIFADRNFHLNYFDALN
jgi:hypothetical protein